MYLVVSHMPSILAYVQPSRSTIPSSSTTPGILSPDSALSKTTSLCASIASTVWSQVTGWVGSWRSAGRILHAAFLPVMCVARRTCPGVSVIRLVNDELEMAHTVGASTKGWTKSPITDMRQTASWSEFLLLTFHCGQGGRRG